MFISGHKCLQRKCLKSNVKNISILRANEIKGKKPEAYTLSPISQGISTELLPTSSYRQVYMETPGISADEEALSLADVMILTAQQHTAPPAHTLRPLCVWQRSLSQDGIGSSRVLPNLSHCTCPTYAGFGLLTDRHYPPKPSASSGQHQRRASRSRPRVRREPGRPGWCQREPQQLEELPPHMKMVRVQRICFHNESLSFHRFTPGHAAFLSTTLVSGRTPIPMRNVQVFASAIPSEDHRRNKSSVGFNCS